MLPKIEIFPEPRPSRETPKSIIFYLADMNDIFETYRGLVCLFSIAILFLIVSRHLILPFFSKIAKKSKNKFDDRLVEHRTVERAVFIIPGFILYLGLPYAYPHSTVLYRFLFSLNNIYIITIAFWVYDSVLHALTDHILVNSSKQGIPLQGVRQAALLIGFLVCTILVGSQITGESPIMLLSGLGALTAVFILIFKDSILGFTAGIQIATFDLVRTGDWIEIPKENINGIVHSVSLTSIRITNWDNTTSILPAYSIVSMPFKNWRLMQESERRRITQTLPIDARSIAPLSDKQREDLDKNPLYAEALKNLDAKLAPDEKPLNLTAFRLCIDAFLRSIPEIDSSRWLIVREKEATGYGIPLEIYAFTTYSKWMDYQEFSATLTDRIIARLPVFGLRLYQKI